MQWRCFFSVNQLDLFGNSGIITVDGCLKQSMGITRAVIVGAEHLCCKGFSESARSADTNQSLCCTDLRIKQVNQHGFVNIIRVGDGLKALLAGGYISAMCNALLPFEMFDCILTSIIP